MNKNKNNKKQTIRGSASTASSTSIFPKVATQKSDRDIGAETIGQSCSKVGSGSKPSSSLMSGTVPKATSPSKVAKSKDESTSEGTQGPSLERPKGVKNVRPSKARYNERRLCLKIIERLSKLDKATLSDRQKQSLAWAKGVIDAQTNLADSGNPDSRNAGEGAGKRLRSPDEKPLPKRTKVTDQLPGPKSFSEVIKDNLVMAVINRGDENGTIPRNMWSRVEAKLADTFFAVLEDMPGPPPVCRDAGWHKGRVKLVAFGDDRSAALYKAAISRLGELWPGAKLDVVSRHDIPSQPRAHAWIPATPSTAESVLKMLRVCNPDLPTHNWKIGRFGDVDGDRRQVVILLNAETLPHLTRSRGIVSYGFGQALLNVYKSDRVLTTDANEPVGEEASTNKPAGEEAVEVAQAMGDPIAAMEEDGYLSSESELLKDVVGLLEGGAGCEHDLLASSENDLLASSEDEANNTVVEMDLEVFADVAAPTDKSAPL